MVLTKKYCICGGAWAYMPEHAKVIKHNWDFAVSHEEDLGFRIVKLIKKIYNEDTI